MALDSGGTWPLLAHWSEPILARSVPAGGIGTHPAESALLACAACVACIALRCSLHVLLACIACVACVLACVACVRACVACANAGRQARLSASVALVLSAVHCWHECAVTSCSRDSGMARCPHPAARWVAGRRRAGAPRPCPSARVRLAPSAQAFSLTCPLGDARFLSNWQGFLTGGVQKTPPGQLAQRTKRHPESKHKYALILGVILGHLGAVLGPLWAVLGRLGAILGPSWDLFGPSWAVLGQSWGHLGPSWAVLGRLGAILGVLLGVWGVLLGDLGATNGCTRRHPPGCNR